MPWKVSKSDQCPASKPWGVFKEGGSGEPLGCHESQEKAQAQQAALYASEASEERGLMSKFRAFFDRLRGLVEDFDTSEPEPQDRAIALQRLYDQLWGSLETRETWAWPLDLYWDEGELYALVAEEGKLYRVGLDVQGETVNLGDWVQVMEVHQPVGRMLIRRQSDGTWRWFSIAATAVLNRVGEIDSTALFDRFVERFRAAEPDARPKRDFFHLGDAGVFGDVDFLERDGWCLIASGTFYDTPLGQAMRRAIQAEPERWGDSISYLPLAEAELVEVAEGVRVPVYNDGELRFISSLYENRAASPFTTARVQEVRRMRAEIVEALKGLTKHGLPDEEIDNIVATVDGTNRQIDDENLVRREAEEEGAIGGEAETPEPVAEEPPVERDAEPEAEAEPGPDDGDAEPEQEREIALDDEAVAAIVAQVLATEQVADLERMVAVQGEQIERLRAELDEYHALAIQRGEQADKRLKALERDDEEKQREWRADLPARSRTVVTYRPREAKEAGDEGKPNLANIAEATLSAWK